MCEVKDSDIKEIKNAMGKLTTDFAVMNDNIQRQAVIIEKLTNSFDKLSIFTEKTDQNNKKIDYLFKRVDEIYNTGTKNCPLSIDRINTLKQRLDKLNAYLIGIVIGIAMQFIAILVYLIDKHLV